MKLGKKLLSIMLAALTLISCFACINFAASAKDAPDAKVKVTFEYNGGTALLSSKTVTVGEPYGTLPSPTKYGFDFDGWWINSFRDPITKDTIVREEEDHTLYAHWKGKEVTVTFDAKGGSVNPNSKTVRYSETYGDLPTPTKGSDTFLGWYTSAVGGTLISKTTTVETLLNQTLYAHWQDASILTPTIAIKNYAETKKIDYRTTITFSAQTKNAAGMEVHWFVNGEDYATGNDCTIKDAKKSFTIQAKLMLRDVKMAESAIENVKVNSGIFARLIAFFRSIFGGLPTVTQGFFDAAVFDNLLP